MDSGVIVEEGKPEETLFAPRTERVRAFLTRYNDRYRILLERSSFGLARLPYPSWPGLTRPST